MSCIEKTQDVGSAYKRDLLKGRDGCERLFRRGKKKEPFERVEERWTCSKAV